MLTAEPPIATPEVVLAQLAKGSIEEWNALLRSEQYLEIRTVLSLLFLSGTLSPTLVGEALRAFRMAVSQCNNWMGISLLEAVITSTLKRIKLPSMVWDLVPMILEKLQGLNSTWDIDQSRGFISKLLSGPIHTENILEVILLLRDLPTITLAEPIIRQTLRKIEDVPIKSIPPAVYQILQWCKTCTKLHSLCFDTIFALFEAKFGEGLDVAECLACMKLALQHEPILRNSFLREARAIIKRGSLMSPYMMILILGLEEANDQSSGGNLIEKNLLQIIHMRAEVGKLGIIDLNLSQWPEPIKTIKNLLSSIPTEDEFGVKALLRLAINLVKNPKLDTKELEMAKVLGLKLIADMFITFPVAQAEILEEIFLILGETPLPKDDILAWFNALVDQNKAVLSTLIKTRHLPVILAAIETSNLFCDAIIKLLIQSENFKIIEEGYHIEYCLAILQCCLLSIHEDGKLKLGVWRIIDIILHDLVKGPRAFSFLVDHRLEIPETGNILIALFNDLCHPHPEEINWTLLVKRCVNIKNNELVLTLPLLLKAIMVNVQSDQEQFLLFQGKINLLAETLLSPIEWFTENTPETIKLTLVPIILGLYDTALEHCVLTGELNGEVLVRTTSCLLKWRHVVVEQISSSIPQKELKCMGMESLTVLLNAFTREAKGGQHSILTELPYLLNIPVIPAKNPIAVTQLLDILAMMQQEDLDTVHKKTVLTHVVQFLLSHKEEFQYSSEDGVRIASILASLIDTADIPSREVVRFALLIKHVLTCIEHGRGMALNLLESCKKFQPTLEADTLLTKALLNMILLYASRWGIDDSIYRQITKDLSLVMRPIRDKDGEDPDDRKRHQSVQYKIITPRTKATVLITLLTHLLEELERGDRLFKLASNIVWQSHDADHIMDLATALLKRLVPSIIQLCQIEITGSNHLVLMKVLIQVFKLAVWICKYTKSRRELPTDLCILLNLMADPLTAAIYEVLPLIQQTEIDELADVAAQKKKKIKALSQINNRLNRESRLIPDLIFNIELLERSILVLSKAQGVTIVRTFHRSTARDFRIQVDELEELLKEESSGEESPLETPQQPYPDHDTTSLQVSTALPDP